MNSAFGVDWNKAKVISDQHFHDEFACFRPLRPMVAIRLINPSLRIYFLFQWILKQNADKFNAMNLRPKPMWERPKIKLQIEGFMYVHIDRSAKCAAKFVILFLEDG